jgi:hypothetical protein
MQQPQLPLPEKSLREKGLREKGLREKGLREKGLREKGLGRGHGTNESIMAAATATANSTHFEAEGLRMRYDAWMNWRSAGLPPKNR